MDPAADAGLRAITGVNLKLLQTFMFVAEHSSFREAADRTHRSQSAVSNQIRELEAQLGVPLFHRTTRRVRLTREGEQLFASAQRAMYEMSLGIRQLYEAAEVRRGRVWLACSPSVAANQLGQILRAFEKELPAVRVTVSELTSRDMFESVRRSEVDFGIGPIDKDTDLSFEALARDEFFALAPKALVDRSKTSITLQALSRIPVLLPNPDSATRRLLDDAFRAAGLTFDAKYQFMQAQTAVAMAEAGIGVAILPTSILAPLRLSATRILRIARPGIVRHIGVVTRRGQILSPAATRFVEIVRERIAPQRLEPHQSAR